MNANDYKFGIIRGDRGRRFHGLCSCGQCVPNKTNYEMDLHCDNCGNEYFIDARYYHGKRFAIPYLKMHRKDNRGFKVERVNLSVVVEEENRIIYSVTPVKENLSRTIDFDFVDEKLEVYRNDKLEFQYNKEHDINFQTSETSRVSSLFMRQLSEKAFVERVSNEVTFDLFDYAFALGSQGWGKSKDLVKGLCVLIDRYKYLQILANAGIPKPQRFAIRGYYHGANPIDDTKTKPHEILKVPKFMLQYLREDVSLNRQSLHKLQEQLGKTDSNKMKEILSIVKDESTIGELVNTIDDIMAIHVDYEYKNLRKLILYLFRETRLLQGIPRAHDSVTYLKDYIRMSRVLGLEYEKYPKSLKKEHDVVMMNYKLINDKNDKTREFKMSVEKKSYSELEYKDKKSGFSVIVPQEVDDLVKEGNSLSHCVSSYVNDVCRDKCKILFLRKTDELDKPLATIEVRGFNIRQARGFANRPLTEEQKEFVSKWAKEKKLNELYY